MHLYAHRMLIIIVPFRYIDEKQKDMDVLTEHPSTSTLSFHICIFDSATVTVQNHISTTRFLKASQNFWFSASNSKNLTLKLIKLHPDSTLCAAQNQFREHFSLSLSLFSSCRPIDYLQPLLGSKDNRILLPIAQKMMFQRYLRSL